MKRIGAACLVLFLMGCGEDQKKVEFHEPIAAIPQPVQEGDAMVPPMPPSLD